MDQLSASQTINYPEIEKYLLFKQKTIGQSLAKIDQDDPLLSLAGDDSPELGTDSWKAEAHIKLITVKGSLAELAAKINACLRKIKEGTYGFCEKCGEKIDPERLKALPMATLCRLHS